MPKAIGVHRRVLEHAGAFRCLDCGRRWGTLLDGPCGMPATCEAPAALVEHRCHWPGCDAVVPPRLWGCARHWSELPAYLRRRVNIAYRPGQEIDKRPSKAYLEAAHEIRQWIEKTNNLKSGRP